MPIFLFFIFLSIHIKIVGIFAIIRMYANQKLRTGGFPLYVLYYLFKIIFSHKKRFLNSFRVVLIYLKNFKLIAF